MNSWALTNALLQFHLDRQDGAGDSADPSGPQADPTLLRPATFGQQSFAASPFSQQSASLTTFSGLQEGLAAL